ncbi:LysR family transcriptional regulator [Roseibium sp. HPY-6]|uniref:LysR family transcriptional regulator n=1 Tax=Roseibium sp. HPY-6 TaxID=3229852 RepID=UPI00338D922D
MFLDRSHLQLLIGLARNKSLSRAAEAQNITQSAASQRLREAERRLGVSLTQKQGRSLTLTNAAEHLVEKALVAERILAEAEAEAQWISRASGPRLRLVLTVFDRLDIVTLSDVLERRGIGLTLLRRMPEQVGSLLTDGLADAVLTLEQHAPLGHLRTHVTQDHLVAVCAPGHPFAMADEVTAELVSHERYFTYSEQPGAGFEYEHFFSPAGVMPTRVERIESSVSLIDLVAAGRGVSVLPRLSVARDAKVGRVKMLSLPLPIPVKWCLSSKQTFSVDCTPAEVSELLATILRSSNAS